MFSGGDGRHGFPGGMPYGHPGMMQQQQGFDEDYQCYSFAFQDKSHLEGSDKIFLPPSALDTLARLHIDYPMLFEVTCKASGKHTHCGVLEFSAAEGTCYLPYWMMQNLLLEEGGFLRVKNVSLPKATFVKFRPQSVDFLDITNPRAVLERALRSFSCVTVGDQICIPYNDKFYYLEIREVKPADAACIIETDCNVDFEAPVGYVDPSTRGGGGGTAESKGTPRMELPKPLSAKGGYVDEKAAEKAAARPAFVGSGQRLDGKPAKGLNGGEAAGGGEAASTPMTAKEAERASRLAALSGGCTLRGGAVAANGTATATTGPAPAVKRPTPALGGKYSQKKGFASFGGSGNSLG